MVEQARGSLRVNARLLDHIGDMAHDDGDLQRSLRTLAERFRTYADQFTMDGLDQLDAAQRRDVVALAELDIVISAGRPHWNVIGKRIEQMMESGHG